MHSPVIARSLFASCLVACGAATPAPTPAPCEDARRAAEGAWRALADDLSPLSLTPADEAARALDARLRAHLAALEEAPREVGGEEAMALSGALMDVIDGRDEAADAVVQARAEAAAEALLTDRSEQGSLRSARAAIAALEAIAPTLTGPRGDLYASATATAEAYARSPEEGDRAAEPTEALVPAGPARDRAIDAGEEARRACGVTREVRLAVPR